MASDNLKFCRCQHRRLLKISAKPLSDDKGSSPSFVIESWNLLEDAALLTKKDIGDTLPHLNYLIKSSTNCTLISSSDDILPH